LRRLRQIAGRISAAAGRTVGYAGRPRSDTAIRREIAAGTYDTEERWLAAEERLLARVCGA
jgi:hypothetical protein